MTLEEYKYYIITKSIDDRRNKEWFDIKPTKIIGKEKTCLSHLIDSFLDERYNWHGQVDVKKFGNSDSIYTQRFINEMETYDLNKYIPHIVNDNKLISIINYASIMPRNYVQKKVVNNQNRYKWPLFNCLLQINDAILYFIYCTFIYIWRNNGDSGNGISHEFA